jgi:hypothetical protein
VRHDHDEVLKQAADALSIMTVLGTLVDALPAIAAVLSIVWTLIRIFESETMAKFLSKFRRPK